MVVPLVVVDYVHLNHVTLQSFVVAIYVSNQPIKNKTSSGRLYMGGRLVKSLTFPVLIKVANLPNYIPLFKQGMNHFGPLTVSLGAVTLRTSSPHFSTIISKKKLV